jgi:hypothetical protein
MVRKAAAELYHHRGVSDPAGWWCECGAEGDTASQAQADDAIASHMAESLLVAALTPDRPDAARHVPGGGT